MTLPRRRRERAGRALAVTLLAAPDGARFHGYDLRRQTGVRSALTYSVLWRWAQAGWVYADWEPLVPGRRYRRRYYQLTALGRLHLTEMVAGVGRGYHHATRRSGTMTT